MTRDHLLGFPPVLLALEPEPAKTLPTTPARPRLSKEEQQWRALLDAAFTSKQPQAPNKKAMQAGADFKSFKKGKYVYKMSDSQVLVWSLVDRCWVNTYLRERVWASMIPASEAMLASLPPKAFS